MSVPSREDLRRMALAWALVTRRMLSLLTLRMKSPTLIRPSFAMASELVIDLTTQPLMPLSEDSTTIPETNYKWANEVANQPNIHHHHNSFWKRPFLPRYARVRHLSWSNPPYEVTHTSHTSNPPKFSWNDLSLYLLCVFNRRVNVDFDDRTEDSHPINLLNHT